MTKDEARVILENWIMEITACTYEISLPIVDEIIHTEINSPEPKIFKDLPMNDEPIQFNQWSFKGLIKIAYDL